MPDTFPGPQPSFRVSSGTTTARVLRSGFGDGYSQRAADGINSVRHVWTLSWENLSAAEAAAVTSFFASKKGYQAFFWTPRGEASPRLFTCEEWRKTEATPGVCSVSATWKEEFDLV